MHERRNAAKKPVMNSNPITRASFMEALHHRPGRVVNPQFPMAKLLLEQVQDNGQLIMVTTSQLDLDTDGQRISGVIYDKTHQDDTSLHWPQGSPLASHLTPFVVIPGGDWGPKRGLKLGDVGLATIDGHDKVVPVLIGDIGPKAKIGEGSLALHKEFGFDRVRGKRIQDVGLDGPFTMVLFPGTGDGVAHERAWVAEKAWQRWEALMNA